MKKALLAMGLILVTSSAFAGMQKVDLQAGSSVRLNVNQATIVTCEGSAAINSSQENCDLKRNNYGSYDVVKGKSVFGTYSFMDDGLALIKKLRESGLCN